MRWSSLLFCYLCGTAGANLKANYPLEYWLSQNGVWTHWYQLIKPYVAEILEIGETRTVTMLVPTSDAVDKFRASPEFVGMTYDGLRDIILYHIIQGTYEAYDISSRGPFLQTLLDIDGVSGGQYLHVEGVTDPEDPTGRGVNFYSGLRRKSSIFVSDFNADGTVLHAIDRVLTIPPPMADTALAAGLTSALGAATAANLDWWHDTDATYFMPTNEAFRSVGTAMNSASDEELQDILTYHYINSTDPVFTSDMNSKNWITAGGEKVSFSQGDGGRLFVNSAQIKQANIIVRNGVMHVIDQVMNPNNSESAEANSSPFSTSAFPDAHASNGAPFAGKIKATKKFGLESGAPGVPFGHLD